MPFRNGHRAPAVTVGRRASARRLEHFPSKRVRSDPGPSWDVRIEAAGACSRTAKQPPSPLAIACENATAGLKPRGMGGATIVLATLRETPVRDETWTDLAILVRRAQAGDREAFGELVEQFERTVHAICLRRLGNANEALEMTQEVFLHVLRRLDQLREPERFAGWLRQVAVRMAINRATRRNAPPTVETVVLEGACTERNDGPLDALITRERAHRLWEALDRLKTIDREVLVAFYIQGQSLIEIADELEAPVGTVKRRLHTARKRLKAELEASVSDSDEWSDGPLEEDDDAELVGAGSKSLTPW